MAILRMVRCVVLTWATAPLDLHAVLVIVTDLAALIVMTILAVPTVREAADDIMSGASITIVMTSSTSA